MSFVNDIIKGVGSALIGTASQVASAKMEYSQTKEGQKRQFEYNKLLNADSYGYQTKLNSTAYNRQKALNSQAYSYSKGLADYSSKLTTAQNQWNALNLPALNRQGYESAGINPVLAVNSQSPAQMIGATGVGSGSAPVGSSPSSSVGGATGAKVELLKGLTDAFKTFQLDKELNDAEVALKKEQRKKVEEETKLMKYDKPLKVIGSAVEDIKNRKINLPSLPNIDVHGKVADTLDNMRNGATSAKQEFKNKASKYFWKAHDFVNDKALYFDHLRRYGTVGHPRWSTYDGSLTRYRRVLEGKYHYKQLFRK